MGDEVVTEKLCSLKDERFIVQTKAFTKWINLYLRQVDMPVDDIFTDFSDGNKLLKLLELLSGDKEGTKPVKAGMRQRFYKMENVNKALNFLKKKVKLESIGAEDIVDGNPVLILGLIWTIILRFQVQNIEGHHRPCVPHKLNNNFLQQTDEDAEENVEILSAKDAKEALLVWCQSNTEGYKNVSIQNFSTSWRSGMAFNAVIHAHWPNLIDYEHLDPANHIYNLNYAFDAAELAGVAKLLDAEDVDKDNPDDLSILTYVTTLHKAFSTKSPQVYENKLPDVIVGTMNSHEERATKEGEEKIAQTVLPCEFEINVEESNEHEDAEEEFSSLVSAALEKDFEMQLNEDVDKMFNNIVESEGIAKPDADSKDTSNSDSNLIATATTNNDKTPKFLTENTHEEMNNNQVTSSNKNSLLSAMDVVENLENKEVFSEQRELIEGLLLHNKNENETDVKFSETVAPAVAVKLQENHNALRLTSVERESTEVKSNEDCLENKVKVHEIEPNNNTIENITNDKLLVTNQNHVKANSDDARKISFKSIEDHQKLNPAFSQNVRSRSTTKNISMKQFDGGDKEFDSDLRMLDCIKNNNNSNYTSDDDDDGNPKDPKSRKRQIMFWLLAGGVLLLAGHRALKK